MTDTPTLVQMPTLSERLSPLQRTIAESYQRVFMRGNRTDDLLIFSSLINEIADSLVPVWKGGVDLADSNADQELERLKSAIDEFKTWDQNIPVDYPARVRFLIHSEQAHADKVDELDRQLIAQRNSEDNLSGKLKDAKELLESLQNDQEWSRAVLKEALGQQANVDSRSVHESIVYLLSQVALDKVMREDTSSADEIALLKDQLKEATAAQEKYNALQAELRPKLEPIFGRQAQTESIEDCFRNLIARYNERESDIAKSREHLISVLGEAQVDGVPLSGAVLVLKGRYSGACARIAQQEAALAQKPTVVVEASKEPASPAIPTHAVVHIEDSPRQAQDKRNPFLRVDGIFQFQSANPNVPWVALSNFDIPRPLLKSMLQMAIGEANTWHDICKTLSVNSDVARDIQRGFTHLINKLRTKAAGAPEIDEAIDKKPEAKMLEVAI